MPVNQTTPAAGKDLQSDSLKSLVLELSKNNPNAALIKAKTEMLGIPYNSDLIILMSEVLVYLSKINSPRKA